LYSNFPRAIIPMRSTIPAMHMSHVLGVAYSCWEFVGQTSPTEVAERKLTDNSIVNRQIHKAFCMWEILLLFNTFFVVDINFKTRNVFIVSADLGEVQGNRSKSERQNYRGNDTNTFSDEGSFQHFNVSTLRPHKINSLILITTLWKCRRGGRFIFYIYIIYISIYKSVTNWNKHISPRTMTEPLNRMRSSVKMQWNFFEGSICLKLAV
jgi:hypothetical protein